MEQSNRVERLYFIRNRLMKIEKKGVESLGKLKGLKRLELHFNG